MSVRQRGKRYQWNFLVLFGRILVRLLKSRQPSIVILVELDAGLFQNTINILYNCSTLWWERFVSHFVPDAMFRRHLFL